jgi:predicted short-subunit dehydrogenase-like oxidoreductase (DUF2520 family)
VKQFTYGIVGRGKLACHLLHYFTLEGLPVIQWHRESPESAHQALASCDVIIVALTDRAIASWIEDHHTLQPRYWVHCSGALVLPGVQGVHPLSTFTSSLYDLTTYRAIPFILEKEGVDFGDIFPKLCNPHFKINRQDKVLYHALCVIMGNLPTLLWQQGIAITEEKIGLPAEIYTPYLTQTLINTIANPKAARTGPMERGDWQTITQHLDVLPEGALKTIYKQFLKLFSSYPCPN